jgi:hypothetical protein
MEFLQWFFENDEMPVDLPAELQEFVYEMAPYGHAIRFSFPANKKRAPGQFVMTGKDIVQLLQKFYNDAKAVLRNPRLDVQYREQLYDYIKHYQEMFNDFFSDRLNLEKSFVVHTSPPGSRFAEQSNKMSPIT